VEPSLLTSWTFEPLQLVPLAVVAIAYAVRAQTLARRGQPVPTWRIALFATGVALLVLALASPLAVVGEEELFSAHMAQHVIIGDLAPLCLLGGLTGPLLRPVLAFPGVERLRMFANPFVALPVWATLIVVWHLPALYDGAVRHDLVHAFEHAAFFTAGIVVWLPVLETLPAPEWFGTGAKLAYVVVVRLVETVIANVFLWAASPFYDEYVHAVAPWGIGAAEDQALAGAVMLAEGGVVTLVALAWLFLRMAEEGEARQELLERGLDPRTVRRAVRYGRWRDLAERDA
jgi:putative membrane protein